MTTLSVETGRSRYHLDYPTPAEACEIAKAQKASKKATRSTTASSEILRKCNNNLMLAATRNMWKRIAVQQYWEERTREHYRVKLTLSDMPHEIIDNILNNLEDVDKIGGLTDRYNVSMCSKKLRSAWNGDSGTLCANGRGRPEYLTPADMDWLEDIHSECGGYSNYTQVDPVVWERDNRIVKGGSMYSYLRNKRLSTSNTLAVALVQQQSEEASIAQPEYTLGGLEVNRRRAMPTRVERAGMAHINKFGKEAQDGGETSSEGSNVLARLSALTTRPDDVPIGYSEGIITTTDSRDILLTESLMRGIPDIRFRNTFMRAEPTSGYERFLISWGYGLKTMPASGKGAAYSDKFSYRLWRKQRSPLRSIKCIDTAMGYDNRITQDVVANQTGNLNARSRPDNRDFQSVFDEMKNLPTQFRQAGAAKAASGDNHVAWLTIALARLYGLKMAAEQEARCYVKMSDANLNRFGFEISAMSRGRASVFTGVAVALANTWFQGTKEAPKEGAPEEWFASQMFELILPSNAADESELIYLAYLSGHLDSSADWRKKDDSLDIYPIFNTVTSEATSRFKIPIANAGRPLNRALLAAWNGNIELGRAESVFNAYVATHELGKQVEVAKQLLAVIMMGANSSKTSSRVNGLPAPNHVSEYDLWMTPAPLANTVFSLVTQHESACLLAVMLQIQGTMRDDIFVSELAAEYEAKEVPITAARTIAIGSTWINKFAPSGPSSWTQAWCEHMFGTFPKEMRRLLSTDKVLMLNDTIEQMSGSVVRISSLLYNKIVPKGGAISLVWDEVSRKNLHMRRFVTGSQSQVLSYLYRGDPSILNTAGVNWLDIVAEVTSRRDLRKMESALGVRTQNTITGMPRIIYMGAQPDLADYNARMIEAQSMTGLTKHYEPSFDSATATFFEDAVVPLEQDVLPGKRHADEPKKPSQRYKVPGGSIRKDPLVNELIEYGANYLGRRYNTSILEWIVPKKPVRAPKSSFESERRPLNPQVGAGNVIHSTASVVRNANLNGLVASKERLAEESEQRISELKQVVAKPKSNVATEKLRPEPAAARKHAEMMMVQNKPIITHAGLTQKVYDNMEFNATNIEVEGDGRCGVRAIEASMRKLGDPKHPSLKELFQTEAMTMGMEGLNRVPSTYFANDYTLAAVCTTLGYSLCIIHFIGNVSSGKKGIRFYECTNKVKKGVVYIELENNHYSGIYTTPANEDELLETTDAGQVLEFMFAPEDKSAEEEADPALTLGGGKPEEEVVPSAQNTEHAILDSNTEFKHASAARRLTGMLDSRVTISTYIPECLWANPFVNPTLGNEPALKFADRMKTYIDGNTYDNAWLEMRKILGDEKLPNEDVCHYTREEFIYYCAYSRTPAALVEMERATKGESRDGYKILKYTTVVPHGTTAPIRSMIMTMFLDGETLSNVTEYPTSPVGILRRWRDISNIITMMPKIPRNRILATTEHTHKVWEGAIRSRLLRTRAKREVADVSCDKAYWEKAFTYRTKMGAMPGDESDSNIELLAAFASLYGCNEEAVWFRSEAMPWLQATVGWLPRDLEWYGVETLILLAVSKGFRVWELGSDENDKHTITEFSAVANNKTLPLIMSEVDGVVRMYVANLPVRSLASFTNLQSCCNTHRENGTLPETPQPGPTIPNVRQDVGVQAMSRTQWVLLGFAVGVSVVALGTVGYRRRRSLRGLIATTRAKLAGLSGSQAQRLAVAEEATDSEPLLGVSDGYANSEFNRGGTPSMISVDICDHQAAATTAGEIMGDKSWDWSISDLALEETEVVPESWAMALYHTVLGAGSAVHEEL